jgi:hypothetical protein
MRPNSLPESGILALLSSGFALLVLIGRGRT